MLSNDLFSLLYVSFPWRSVDKCVHFNKALSTHHTKDYLEYRSVRKCVHFNKVLTIYYSKDYMEVQLTKAVSLLGSLTENERSWRIVSDLEITASPKIWPHQEGRPHGSWSPPPSYLSTSSVLLHLPRFLEAMSIERR